MDFFGSVNVFLRATDNVKRLLANINIGQPSTLEDDFEDKVATSGIFYYAFNILIIFRKVR